LLAAIMEIEDDITRNKVEKIYTRYYSTMFYIAKGILHDENLAEDAVSDAVLKIIENVDKFGEVDCNKTRGFVVIIVRNIALNILKSKSRHQTIPIADVDNTDSGDPVLDSLTVDEACQEISDAIMRLNKNYSDILNLSLIHNLSITEISEILDLTETNARSRLSRAKKALRKELSKEMLI
jgi:RNA polymerase sigma-70 factor (ECF subfamily)